MWIETDGNELTPPVDFLARFCLDVGLPPVIECAFTVEKILRTYSHSNPRKWHVESPIHILENSLLDIHIWGATSLQN
jgi:hypothetical protein